jgi:excinuclease UvrABC nuclease subunit
MAKPDEEFAAPEDFAGPSEKTTQELRREKIQQWLPPYVNPLEKRLGKEFFKTAPREAGVYLMRDVGGGILYVGKAKNLRARLNSYKRARPDQVSRKVIRLINAIRSIELERCESEKAALLRENQLLRELRPPYNVVNTSPETYYFIGIRQIGREVRFRLTTHPKRQGDLMYGAFKGRGSVRRGYTSLLRLIWVAHSTQDRFSFPYRLTCGKPPYLFSVEFPSGWLPQLKRFLNGTDRGLLVSIMNRLLENETIPRFVHHVIQEDIEEAKHFFEAALKRNRLLKKHHSVRGRLIAQEQVDDLLVLERTRLGMVEDVLPGLRTETVTEGIALAAAESAED